MNKGCIGGFYISFCCCIPGLTFFVDINRYLHLGLIPGSSSVVRVGEVYNVESFHSNRLAVTDLPRSKWAPWQRRSSERLLQMNMTLPYPVLTWLHCNCLLHQSLSPCGKGLLVDGQKALSVGPIHSAEIHRSGAHSLSRLITPATAHGPGLAFNALIFTLRSTTATYARERKRHRRFFRCGSEKQSFRVGGIISWCRRGHDNGWIKL